MSPKRLLKIRVGRAATYRVVQLLAAVPLNLFFFAAHNIPKNGYALQSWYMQTALVSLGLYIPLALAAIVLMYRTSKWGFRLGAIAFCSVLPWFVLTFHYDWRISCIGIGVNAWIAYSILHKTGRQFTDNAIEESEKEKEFGRWTYSLLWLNGIGILVSVLSAGYMTVSYFEGVMTAYGIIIAILGISLYFELKYTPPTLRHGPYLEWILLGCIAGLALYRPNLRVDAILIAVRQMVVLIRYYMKTPYAGMLSRYFFRRPAQLLVMSFASVIVMGTVLLTLPDITPDGHSLRFVDALFTATSGTCVTGLIVLDTAVDFSILGQLVILFLIQIGGLGIMTISTFAAISLGRNIGLGQEYSLGSMIGEASYKHVYLLIKFICILTLCVEALGASIFFPQFLACGMPVKTAIWKSIFHSISAFCNAGFSLQSTNLAPFQFKPGILLTFSALIIIGGLGFGVLYWLWNHLFGSRHKDSFHVTIVIRVTLILLTGMTLFVLISEYYGALDGFSLTDKLANAWFCAVTPRTAGFNTVAMNALQPATRVLTIVLMFIGVAPGSTGGGIKITTLVVLILTIRTLMRGGADVQGYRYAVSISTVYRAAAVFVLGITGCATAFFALVSTQALPYEMLLFETVSAFGTVGLSLGATPALNDAGRIIIILLMFIGRVGPLTLVLSLRPLKKQEIYYPTANVMVG